MRAGEDPGNTVAANKTARDQAFARLVKLLHEMGPAKNAAASKLSPAEHASASTPLCHDPAR
jgi:carboxymethylenebutenolidase